ncbi:hypothetical protein [Flavobacterium fluviatile]|uniref:hypothetical protein n=1 Tax=Flavobacterium fluviatile TaxID=1862387 RepID=UPI0013D2CF17|nr:hypothetical protein [Flavobacterium fluviatile]
MNTHEFILNRNSEIKAMFEVLRADKTLNRKSRLEKIAKEFRVSPSTVHDAVYRKPVSEKANA